MVVALSGLAAIHAFLGRGRGQFAPPYRLGNGINRFRPGLDARGLAYALGAIGKAGCLPQAPASLALPNGGVMDPRLRRQTAKAFVTMKHGAFTAFASPRWVQFDHGRVLYAVRSNLKTLGRMEAICCARCCGTRSGHPEMARCEIGKPALVSASASLCCVPK